MIKTIIFDLGNVIVNVNENRFLEKLAASSDKILSDVKSYYENSSYRKSFERGEINAERFHSKLINDLCFKMSINEFKKTYCDIFTLNRGVAEIVKHLKKRFRLILLSNTDILHFEYIKNKYKIINIFDDYVLSYKVGCRKPNPLIFLNALRKAKTLPFNCVFIDDIPEFVYVARLMGIRAFQYKKYEKLVEDLRKVKVLTKGL